MKNILFPILCLFFQFSTFAFSRVESTPMMQICRDVEMSLTDDFLIPGKPLPSSFEEMTFLRECAEITWSNPKNQIHILNKLAIIPGAPEVKSQQGISRGLLNHRIFAISRTWNFDYAKKGSNEDDPMNGGRFAILISPNGSSATPNWIPESEARIILEQLKDFDPNKQPLAFESIIHRKREGDPKQGESNKNSRDHLKKSKEIKSDDQSSSPRGRYWIAAGIMLATLLIWMALRKRATN